MRGLAGDRDGGSYDNGPLLRVNHPQRRTQLITKLHDPVVDIYPDQFLSGRQLLSHSNDAIKKDDILLGHSLPILDAELLPQSPIQRDGITGDSRVSHVNPPLILRIQQVYP